MSNFLSDVEILNNVLDKESNSIVTSRPRWELISGPVTSSIASSGTTSLSGWISTAGYSEMQFAIRVEAGVSSTNGAAGLTVSLDGTNALGTYLGGYAGHTGTTYTTTNGAVLISIGGNNNTGYTYRAISSPKHIVQGGYLPPFVRLEFIYAAGTSSTGTFVWFLHGRKA